MTDPTNEPQDMAEATDSDKLGTPDDPEVEPGYPPDEPLGVDEFGLTSAEEQVGEPLDERVEREVTDPLVDELEHSDPTAAPVGAVAAGADPEDPTGESVDATDDLADIEPDQENDVR